MSPVRESALLDVYARADLEIVEGRGVRVRSADGREFLDFYAGHAVAALGYGHPALTRELREQAASLFFQSNAVRTAVQERAAARLAALAPQPDARVFFCNSGAEAVENALRVACRATGRSVVVAVAGGFHGRTAAAGAATDHAARWYGFPRTPFDLRRVPFDDVTALETAVRDDVAAVIFEPVQGIAGARAFSDAWIRRARALCDGVGALLVADEVQSGVGRCGRFFAIEKSGVVPDLVALAKGLAGGFPAGALLTSREVAHGLSHGDLGSTFGGAPMAAALIETVATIVSDEDFLARVRARGDELAALAGTGPVVAVQGEGLLRGLRTRRPAKEVLVELRARGILAGGSDDPHVLRLTPPLVVGPEDVACVAAALEEIAP